MVGAIPEGIEYSPLELCLLTNREACIIKEAAHSGSFLRATPSLSISWRTVEVHLYNAREKLNIKDTFSLTIAALSQGELSLDDLLSYETLRKFEDSFPKVTSIEKEVAQELYRSALEEGFTSHKNVARRSFSSLRTIEMHISNFYKTLGLKYPNPVLSAAAFYAYVKWSERLSSGNESECPVQQPESVQLGNGACLTARQLQVLKQAASLDHNGNSAYQTRYWLRAHGINDCRAKIVLALSKGYLSIDDLVNKKAKVLESQLSALSPLSKEVLLALYHSALEGGAASNADMASFLGIPASRVKSRLTYSRSKLPVLLSQLQLSVAAYYLAQKMVPVS